jgi:peptide-methionine (S)-S-oxide reductase
MSTTSCRIPIPDFPDPAVDTPLESGGRQAAVFAGGCFWCVEAVFKELVGVESVRSGYAGGTSETANYKAVCSGRTDHAEVIEIIYDPARVSYGQLLKIHFSIAHDPTQLNRQGNDAGRQYRSAIFYANEEQRRIAEAYIRQLNEAGVFSGPIVTTLEPLKEFFVAEDYHQNYAALNPGQPYIQYVSQPKVEKLRTYFRDRLKK